MSYLLDTHIWLWMITDPGRLGRARPIIEDAAIPLHFSAASTWEIAIKVSIGKLPLPREPAVYIPEMIRSTAVSPLPVEHAHAAAVASLPLIHLDPFDRLLVAQAQAEKLTLITADPILSGYDVDLFVV